MKRLIEKLRDIRADILGLPKCFCKGDGYSIPPCEYDSVWFCKHPRGRGVITSVDYEKSPSECPKFGRDVWR